MYWTHRSLPELADLPKAERDRLWKQARKDPLRLQDAAFVLVFFAVAIPTGFVEALPQSPKWLHFALFAALDFSAFAAIHLMFIVRYRPVVRRLRATTKAEQQISDIPPLQKNNA